jgi:serine/threonine protein phosphatase PrpC
VPRIITCYGASVRGPLHKREGIPNEDAWLRFEGAFGSLVVVCDGMGSRAQAKLGSRAACAAAREAVIRWTQADGAPTSYLAHLIEVLWRLRIHPHLPHDAATTCLLALARKNGELVVGGIGDGLVAVRSDDTPISVVIGNRQSGFGNETLALGASPGPKAWRLSLFPPSPLSRIAVLATDGVADDLVSEKLDEFCLWLVERFHDLGPTERWRQLAAELRAWPTPKHLDDKTIAVLKISAWASKEME